MSHVSTFLLTWSIEKTASQNMGSFKTIPCLRSDSTAEVVFQGTFSQPRGWHFTQGSINMNLGSSILHHFLREEIKKNENDRMNLFCHECRKFIEGFEDGNVWNIILGWPYLSCWLSTGLRQLMEKHPSHIDTNLPSEFYQKEF